MVGVENECQKYGSKVFLQTISQPDDHSLWDLHKAGRLDGLILVGADVYPSIVEQAKEYQIPRFLSTTGFPVWLWIPWFLTIGADYAPS